MKILILGAGQVGRTAADHLSREEANEVTVVDNNEDRANFKVSGWKPDAPLPEIPPVIIKELDEWKFVRKEFERIYRDVLKNGLPAGIPRLVGTHERKNALAGQRVEPVVVRIGEEDARPAALGEGSR